MGLRGVVWLGLISVVLVGCGSGDEVVEPDEAAAEADDDATEADDGVDDPSDDAPVEDAGETADDAELPASGDTLVGTFVVELGEDDGDSEFDWWCLYLDLDDDTRWPIQIVGGDVGTVDADGLYEDWDDDMMTEADLMIATGDRAAVTVDEIASIDDWGPRMAPCGDPEESVINAAQVEPAG